MYIVMHLVLREYAWEVGCVVISVIIPTGDTLDYYRYFNAFYFFLLHACHIEPPLFSNHVASYKFTLILYKHALSSTMLILNFKKVIETS